MAVNVALAWPGGICRLAGMVTFVLLTDRGTVNPPAGAGPVKVAVQGVLAGVLRFAVVQFRPARDTTCDDNEIAPDPPLAVIPEPSAVETNTPVTWIGIGFAEGEGAI